MNQLIRRARAAARLAPRARRRPRRMRHAAGHHATLPRRQHPSRRAAASAPPKRRRPPRPRRPAAASAGGAASRRPARARTSCRCRCRPTRCAPMRASTSTTLARAADLWDRVRRGFAMPDLDSDLVRDREQWYATRPDYVAAHDRARRPLPVPHRRGARASATCRPSSRCCRSSRAPSTRRRCRARARPRACGSSSRRPARDFELKQNIFRDDRRDVLASTRAALDYLQKLLRHVRRLAARAGRLQLGRRQRAARDRAQPEGRPADRLRDLKMPAETRSTCPSCRR